MMKQYSDMIRPYNAPLMPLGSMPSDEIISFDHVLNAIGSVTMAQTGVVRIINSVTREEHTGKVPSFDSVLYRRNIYTLQFAFLHQNGIFHFSIF